MGDGGHCELLKELWMDGWIQGLVKEKVSESAEGAVGEED